MPSARAYRLASLDAVRGLVVVVMALDHVRDFVMRNSSLDPMTDPDTGPALFFTRWITHFCAPVFVFLAGSSAGLMLARRSPSELGAFLLKRGLWLIAVEVFIISTGFSFAPGGIREMDGLIGVPLQVIWAIGASMVVLAGAQFLGRTACLGIGTAVVIGHNLLDRVWPFTKDPFDAGHPLWVGLHAQMGVVAPPFYFAIVYPVLPWIGVMLLGFGAAAIFEGTPAIRDRRLRTAGLTAIVLFLTLRLTGIYGDPNPWQMQDSTVRSVMDILNVTKYPPSLLFLLMTLGPAAVLCAAAHRLPHRVNEVLVTFGRVPFAFYVAHFYLIHVIAIGLGVVQGFRVRQFLTFSFFYPQGFGVPLAGVYAVWALVIVLLYPWCRWMAAVKARRGDWWLSYV